MSTENIERWPKWAQEHANVVLAVRLALGAAIGLCSGIIFPHDFGKSVALTVMVICAAAWASVR